MLKKSLIILSTFLFFSVLITGFPLKIDIISSEDNPFFSLENINHFVYAQDDSDKSESSSDKSESSSDKSESSSDNSNFDSNDEKSKENTEGNTPNFQSSPHLKDANGSDEKSKENNEMNTPDFLASPDGDTAVDPPVGGDNPPPVGGDNPPPVGGDNPDTSKDKNNIKDKINLEFDKITKIISKTKNKVIVKDDSDSEKEIIIVTDPTCP